jgi:hypothetical protein
MLGVVDYANDPSRLAICAWKVQHEITSETLFVQFGRPEEEA